MKRVANAGAESARGAAGAARRESPLEYQAFEDALRAGGCAVCRVVEAQEERALYSFLYEGMTNPEVREEFLRGGGFCAIHLREAASLGINRWSVGVVELGILAEQTLRRASAELKDGAKQRGSKAWRRLAIGKRRAERPLYPGRDCTFCRERESREAMAVESLEALAADAEIAAGIERSELCLRHGQMALEKWKGTERRAWLAELLERHAARLREELREFLRKYDHRFRKESFGAEADAVPRAVEFLSGAERRKRR